MTFTEFDTPVRYAKAKLYTWSVDPSGDPDKPHRMTVIRRRNQQGWPLFSSLHSTYEEAVSEGQKTVNRLLNMATLIDRLKKKPATDEPAKNMSDEKPIRYEGEHLPAHQDIAGFKLETLLRNVMDDPNQTADARSMAKRALVAGDTSALWGLHDALTETGHPSVYNPETGEGYSLHNAVAAIHLDRAIGHSVNAVTPVVGNMDMALGHLRNVVEGKPAHPKAVGAIGVLKMQGHSNESLLKSLDRHLQRRSRNVVRSIGLLDPTTEETEALKPKKGDSEAYRADRKLKYGVPDTGDELYSEYPVTPVPKTKPKILTRNDLIARIRQQALKRKRQNLEVDQLPEPIPPKPKLVVPKPEEGYDTKTGKPKPAWEVYRSVNVPEKYRSSPALSEFIQAVRNVRSSQQEVRRKIAAEQYKKLKLKVEAIRDAISDAPHTASANTAHAILHDGDLAKVNAGAALYGIQTNSPALLVFHEDESGSSFLHKFGVMGSAEKLRKRLDEAGLPNRTLLPTENGWDVAFFDPDGSLTPLVQKAAASEGAELQTSKGSGTLLGGGDEAEGEKSSRQSFRSVIRSYERSLQPQQVPVQ